jgi:hypothetical protein
MKALSIAFVVLGLRSIAGVLGAAIQVPLSTTPSTGGVEGDGEGDWEIASKWCFGAHRSCTGADHADRLSRSLRPRIGLFSMGLASTPRLLPLAAPIDDPSNRPLL